MRIVRCNRLAAALTLLLLASSLSARFTYPARQFQDIEAQLTVEVADRTRERGLGEATLTLTLTGPETLEVEKPHLDDAAAAWQEERPPSSRDVDDANQRATWRQVLRLKQSKKGIETLPDVSVRFRDGPDAKWQETKWVDILKHIRDAQPPPVPGEDPPSWLRRWGFVLVMAVTALLVLLLWLRKRGRPRREAALPPDQWALREIERIESALIPPRGEAETYHTQMSFVIRRYLTERFGLHALQQTTTEFLEAVQRTPQATARQQTLLHNNALAALHPQLTAEQQALLSELFELCDLAKFARASTSPEECHNTAELARQLVRQTSKG